MNSKKIVIISSNSLGEQVTRNRLLPFIKLLVNEGVEVTMICPQDKKNNINLKGYSLKEVDLIKSKSNKFISRAINEFKNSLKLLKVAKDEASDGYLITIPSMFLTFLSPIFLYRNNTFLDIRDLTWEYLSEERLLHKISKKLFRFLFAITINYNRFVAVTNPKELEYTNRLWIRQQHPFLVSNGIMKDQFDSLDKIEVSKSETLTITYIGNIGIAQNLTTLVEAATLLPQVKFVIVGSGILHDEISKLIKLRSLSNMVLTGRLPWNEVKKYYDDADILYAQLSPEFSGAIPSKLYEYLSTGKFIVYGGCGEAKLRMNEFSFNKVIEPNNPEDLVNAIEEVYKTEDYKSISFENKIAIKENYIRENTAKEFIHNIINII